MGVTHVTVYAPAKIDRDDWNDDHILALEAGDIPDLSGTYAASGHAHSGTYDPAGTAASAVGAHSSDTTSVHGIADTSALATDSDVSSAISALSSVYQPLDSDLTSIAALTTTAFGRGLLELADASALHASSGATKYVPGGSASGHASAVTAGVALQAAIDALPATGGTILLGAGYFTWASGGPDLRGLRGVTLRGVGNLTGGADSATVLEYTGEGAGSFLDLGSSTGCTLADLEVRYTDTDFTGVLVDLRGDSPTVFTSALTLRNVLVWGSHAAGQTAKLVSINIAQQLFFDKVYFNGGGVQVEGRRAVAVTGVSVANPSVITAPGHGYSTGDYVSIGGTNTSATILGSAAELPITVTGDDTFTVPVNVATVTTGTGFVSCHVRDWASIISFRDCEFRNAVVMPIRNAGEAWTFDNCNTLALANSGDVGFYSHDPGVLGKGFRVTNCWFGDQTSANNGSWITYGGYGLTVHGSRFGGRAVTSITAVTFDEDNCDGFSLVGNVLEQMAAILGFGTTTGNPRGEVLGFRFSPSVVGGGAAITGTLPRGIGFFPTAASTNPDGYVFSGASTATVMRFDGDTSAQMYRNGSGAMQVTGSLSATGELRSNSSAAAGLISNTGYWQGAGSSSNIGVGMDAKGTGVVGLGINTGTGGVQIGRAANPNYGFGSSGAIGTPPTVTGSRGSNEALASLLTGLAARGLIVDSSS